MAKETAPETVPEAPPVVTEKPIAPAPVSVSDLVSVTITKFGDGKVSTGIHVAGEGDIYAKRGERLDVSPAVARSLEALGLAEAD